MSQIKERPILFSAPMVRAILEDRKTVTRRACKPQPSANAHTTTAEGKPMGAWWETGKNVNRCPYGQPGERLWVRETWAEIRVAQAPDQEWIVYRECDNRTDYGGPWKPSIFMPRRACRILLEITAVRVERLQDISEGQARAEGVCTKSVESFRTAGVDRPAGFAFRDIWTSINGNESWGGNPWVWVVEFTRVTP